MSSNSRAVRARQRKHRIRRRNEARAYRGARGAEPIREGPTAEPRGLDPVDVASDQSFPASDPPSFIPMTSIGPHRRPDEPRGLDPVDEASDESFPASDPPSFTPVTSVGSNV